VVLWLFASLLPWLAILAVPFVAWWLIA